MVPFILEFLIVVPSIFGVLNSGPQNGIFNKKNSWWPSISYLFSLPKQSFFLSAKLTIKIKYKKTKHIFTNLKMKIKPETKYIYNNKLKYVKTKQI